MLALTGRYNYFLGGLFLGFLSGVMQPVLAAEPSSARQNELLALLKNDCGACHGLTLQGGMGPALLPETLSGKPDDFLVATILNGRKGTAMPPWQTFMTQDDALWLVHVLRKNKH